MCIKIWSCKWKVRKLILFNKFFILLLLFNFNYRPSDFITGEIIMNDKVVSKITGSYLNFIEFDGLRFWDIRENLKTNVNIENILLKF